MTKKEYTVEALDFLGTQRPIMALFWVTLFKQIATVMLATARIAAEHGWFTRIRQIAPIRFLGPTQVCLPPTISRSVQCVFAGQGSPNTNKKKRRRRLYVKIYLGL